MLVSSHCALLLRLILSRDSNIMYGLYSPGLCPSYDGWMVHSSYPKYLKVIEDFNAFLLFFGVFFFCVT
jgi:hypothetical protein